MPHSLQRRYRRQTTGHDHGNETNKYQKCYSGDELFAIYQVERMTGFTLEKFQSLSSALLQQIESEACAESHDDHSSNDDVAAKHKWGYSVLAVAIISLLSLVGVAIIPFMNRIFYKISLVFFIALAIGTLAGDALLHLFPH
ncbi:Zinc transporter ZIP14, partial [Paramuricea clavata]